MPAARDRESYIFEPFLMSLTASIADWYTLSPVGNVESDARELNISRWLLRESISGLKLLIKRYWFPRLI